MNTDSIIAAIDADIEQLQSARAALLQVNVSSVTTSADSPSTRQKRGKAARTRIAGALRKRRITTKDKKNASVAPVKQGAAQIRKSAKRKLSVEARKRIADAQRKRWAAIKAKKAAPAKKAIKKASPKKAAPAKKATSAKKVTVKKAAELSEKKATPPAAPQAPQS